jgi:hypothetical protein
MTTKQEGIVYWVAAIIFSIIIAISFFSCGSPACGQRVNNPTDSLPKQKTYTLTYERNSLYVNLDSLNSLSRYLGSALDKDSWIQVIGAYNRILGRVATMGKLDSLYKK